MADVPISDLAVFTMDKDTAAAIFERAAEFRRERFGKEVMELLSAQLDRFAELQREQQLRQLAIDHLAKRIAALKSGEFTIVPMLGSDRIGIAYNNTDLNRSTVQLGHLSVSLE